MDLWTKVLKRISEKISKPSFDTWLANTTAEIDNDVLIVKAQNDFQVAWLEERYKVLIFETVREIAGKTMEIDVIDPREHLYSEALSSPDYQGLNGYDELMNLIKAQQKQIYDLEERVKRLEHPEKVDS